MDRAPRENHLRQRSALVLVALAPAHVGFVDLDGLGSGKLFKVAGAPCLADALEHKPCGFLGDADIPVGFMEDTPFRLVKCR